MDDSSPRIYGFGSAALDFRITTAEFGENYRDKLLARKELVLGGGSVANALVQAARLGGAASWLGKLGVDWIGDKIVSDLDADNVDCSHVIRDPARCSPFNVAVYAEGRRVGGFLLPNSLETITEDEAADLGGHVREGDWVIVEIGEVPLDRVLAFCQAVRKGGGSIAVDVDLDPVRQCVGPSEAAHGIFAMADLLVPNRSAMGALYPELSPSDLARAMACDYEVPTVVTAGEAGAYWCLPGEQPCHRSAESVEVADTVGAGDAFHGGLLYALSCGHSLDESVSLAARCGAAACTAFGARTGMLRRAGLA